MTHAIDENTGLPVLPEGHRWVIAPKAYRMDLDGQLWQKNPNILTIWIEKFWQGEVMVLKENNKWYIPRHERIQLAAELGEKTERILSVDLSGNNPIAARNAANRAMKEFEALKMRDSLIGTYPPKNLEG